MTREIRFSLMTTLLLAAGGVVAQPQSNLTSEEIVKALQPPVMTRSLGASGGKARNLVPTVDLMINFDFDSATLRGESKDLLKNLAAALRDQRLSQFRFRVEGHTDAKGTAAYNDALSERRAQTVVGFLAAEGVSAERLDAVGKGFNELLDPNNPQAPENRRVRVSTLP